MDKLIEKYTTEQNGIRKRYTAIKYKVRKEHRELFMYIQKMLKTIIEDLETIKKENIETPILEQTELSITPLKYSEYTKQNAIWLQQRWQIDYCTYNLDIYCIQQYAVYLAIYAVETDIIIEIKKRIDILEDSLRRVTYNHIVAKINKEIDNLIK